jgi:hypothetical protein
LAFLCHGDKFLILKIVACYFFSHWQKGIVGAPEDQGPPPAIPDHQVPVTWRHSSLDETGREVIATFNLSLAEAKVSGRFRQLLSTGIGLIVSALGDAVCCWVAMTVVFFFVCCFSLSCCVLHCNRHAVTVVLRMC